MKCPEVQDIPKEQRDGGKAEGIGTEEGQKVAAASRLPPTRPDTPPLPVNSGVPWFVSEQETHRCMGIPLDFHLLQLSVYDAFR